MKYLIYSKKRSADGFAAWWNPDSRGYTTDINAAGRFDHDKALEIQRDSRGDSFAIAEDRIPVLKSRLIVDLGDGNNSSIIEGLAIQIGGLTGDDMDELRRAIDSPDHVGV
jgi:hypothetical protein